MYVAEQFLPSPEAEGRAPPRGWYAWWLAHNYRWTQREVIHFHLQSLRFQQMMQKVTQPKSSRWRKQARGNWARWKEPQSFSPSGLSFYKQPQGSSPVPVASRVKRRRGATVLQILWGRTGKQAALPQEGLSGQTGLRLTPTVFPAPFPSGVEMHNAVNMLKTLKGPVGTWTDTGILQSFLIFKLATFLPVREHFWASLSDSPLPDLQALGESLPLSEGWPRWLASNEQNRAKAMGCHFQDQVINY